VKLINFRLLPEKKGGEPMLEGIKRYANDRRGANKLVYMAAAVAIAALLVAIGLNIRSEVDARVDQASAKLQTQIASI
jgi:Flp pilus assembly pilin Flp